MRKTKVSKKIDRISFQLGMINCFAEMVECGVKKLALSPPVTPEDYTVIKDASDDIVKGFGIKSYLEKSLLVTDLQSPEFTKGKWTILYYEDDEVLEAYLALKEKKHHLEQSGGYDKTARQEISRAFMRLLSYPEDKIEEKLSKKSLQDPYMLVKE
ncbi:hypothetical protein AMJ80_12460 [bacterium SM23_31]|nr:MAG: hypothetical protein AMJ80_12460 [bacterium SM23_31]